MHRVTRSTAQKQGELICNDSLLYVIPDRRIPAGEVREVLGEITSNTEENTAPVPPRNPVDVELKGLKAAYRTALGIKKKKKPKKPKNPEGIATTAETLDNLVAGVQADSTTMAPGLIEAHYNVDVTTVNDNNFQHAAPIASPTRMTRQQLAKQHSSQFEQDISFQDGSGSHPGAYQNPRSFSSQLISNLTDSQVEIYRTLMITNHSLNLADEMRRGIEGIINIPEVKEHLKQQPNIEVNSIVEERDVKMLSPVDEKTPTATLQVPTKATEVQNSSDKAIDNDDDSFARVITSRSPAKPVSRSDYVDELDKIEDVMDALDEATSPNVKANSPGKIAFLSGKHGSFHGGEHLSRIFSPTDVELTKLRTLNAGGVAAQGNGSNSNDGSRSLRVKPRAGLLQPHSSLRKAKSMHFETRNVSESSDESQRPLTAPDAQSTQVLSRSRSSSGATDTRPLIKGPLKNKRPVSLLPPKQPTKSTKPPTRPAFELPGEAVARKLKEQREARRVQRESEDVDSRVGSVNPKIRSTKTLTKSTFELPGEAISRRKREAHGVRLKQQEEEEKKRREFKARPSRCNFLSSGGVRETAASRARLSMHVQNEIDTSKQTDSLNVAKRGSTITRRPPLPSHDSNISSSNARLPAAALIHRNLTPHATVVGTARPAPKTTSMTGLSTQRSSSIRQVSSNQKGKEIYQRHERALADLQRERREKEEAAKRSREFAAERGRQASREWAEKQKAKARKDVGLGPGFGPGGQLGLKG